ncbi:pyridoxamine 5'-phosphate oxidase family protein [Streptomyces mayteni]
MSQKSDVGHGDATPAALGKRTDVVCDPAAWKPILTAGFVCTVAYSEFGTDGEVSTVKPRCVPMVYAYQEEAHGVPFLYLHGSTHWPGPDPQRASLRNLWREGGVPVCLTVTLVDGLMVGRAAISTSLNYRSVVVDGIAEQVRPEDRKKAFEALAHQIIPGRWSEYFPLGQRDLDTDGAHSPDVGVISVNLADAHVCAKTHQVTTPQHEDHVKNPETYWAGVIPIHQTYGEPRPDKCTEDHHLPEPDSVRNLVAKGNAPSS